MQRVINILRPEVQPDSEPETPVWCLGREYENNNLEWNSLFLDDVESRIWLMYRTGFDPPIPRHPDGPSPVLQNVNAFIRSIPHAGLGTARSLASFDTTAFTTDAGWGCMIRTSQCLVANALQISLLGRDYRYKSSTGTSDDTDATNDTNDANDINDSNDSNNSDPSDPKTSDSTELSIIKRFLDTSVAPYSIHRFVEYGTNNGILPGQWFGPGTVAGFIAASSEEFSVYRSDGTDVYEKEVLKMLDCPKPVLVLCNLRLGIQNITPVYYEGLKSLLAAKQSVGIAGGRTSASLYFFGYQNDRLFYHDPHEPKPALTQESSAKEILESVHSRKLRALPISEMDPSMLAAFLITSKEDYLKWKEYMLSVPEQSRIMHFLPNDRIDFTDISEEDINCDAEGYVLCEAPEALE
ncbi:cysteine protease [Starmerella bacillaris]|uniref:Cysteine protease n=1 Tax=Starmerella bacillaris TaxID=1247836 RepID=A0AAV5RIA4_STABA|nr:cysteine protease [Starmerella bacillaris]